MKSTGCFDMYISYCVCNAVSGLDAQIAQQVVYSHVAHGFCGSGSGGRAVRAHHKVVEFVPRGVGRGFLLKNVKARTVDAALLQGRQQGGFVDQPAACGVDEHGGLFHAGQTVGIDAIAGFVC